VVDVGSLAGWLAVVGVAAVAWITWRGGGSTAIATLEASNRVLERRVRELEVQRKLDLAQIVELRARTDITEALQPLIDAVVRHEDSANARYGKTARVLDRIADKLDAPP
jgi:hypothetical protein